MKICFSYKVQQANLGSRYIVCQQLKVNKGECEDGGAAGYENHGVLLNIIRLDPEWIKFASFTLYPK